MNRSNFTSIVYAVLKISFLISVFVCLQNQETEQAMLSLIIALILPDGD